MLLLIATLKTGHLQLAMDFVERLLIQCTLIAIQWEAETIDAAQHLAHRLVVLAQQVSPVVRERKHAPITQQLATYVHREEPLQPTQHQQAALPPQPLRRQQAEPIFAVAAVIHTMVFMCIGNKHLLVQQEAIQETM
jgi:hypothetical protein